MNTYSKKQRTCCIKNCNKKVSIRNFSSLLGSKNGYWEIKDEYKNLQTEDATHKMKICVDHYNKDLKLFPRNPLKHLKKNVKGKQLKKTEKIKETIPLQQPSKCTKQASTSIPFHFLDNVSITFNLSNEPCMKYNLSLVQDAHSDIFTSKRLEVQVIFLENAYERFELARYGSIIVSFKKKKYNVCTYRFSRVNCPMQMDYMTIPLPEHEVKILAQDILWYDIQWGTSSITVKGKEYPIEKMYFKNRTVS